MQECPKCNQMIGKGFYLHSKYCDGTIKEKKVKSEPVKHREPGVEYDLFGSPIPPKKIEKTEPVWSGEPEEKTEPEIHVEKHDAGSGLIITVLIIVIGLYLISTGIIGKAKEAYQNTHAQDEIPFFAGSGVYGDGS